MKVTQKMNLIKAKKKIIYTVLKLFRVIDFEVDIFYRTKQSQFVQLLSDSPTKFLVICEYFSHFSTLGTLKPLVRQ